MSLTTRRGQYGAVRTGAGHCASGRASPGLMGRIDPRRHSGGLLREPQDGRAPARRRRSGFRTARECRQGRQQAALAAAIGRLAPPRLGLGRGVGADRICRRGARTGGLRRAREGVPGSGDQAPRHAAHRIVGAARVRPRNAGAGRRSGHAPRPEVAPRPESPRAPARSHPDLSHGRVPLLRPIDRTEKPPARQAPWTALREPRVPRGNGPTGATSLGCGGS